jgi:N-acetylglucosamine kinase-like BadF-type ATPase
VGQVDEVRFFGAGCSSAERNLIIQKPLEEFFRGAKVTVDHDILGAGIACVGDGEGIACIIGTGSNSCYCKDHEWSQVVPALGHLLGDEASGSYLGRRMLADYLYKLLPESIATELQKEHGLTKEGIFESAYHKPDVNVYFASFARILSKYLDEPYVRQVVTEGFHRFLDIHVMRYPHVHDLTVHFVGSIAYHFEPLLDEVLATKGLRKGGVHKKPIHPLYAYYASKR